MFKSMIFRYGILEYMIVEYKDFSNIRYSNTDSHSTSGNTASKCFENAAGVRAPKSHGMYRACNVYLLQVQEETSSLPTCLDAYVLFYYAVPSITTTYSLSDSSDSG